MDEERAADILEWMSPDEAADVLGDLNSDCADAACATQSRQSDIWSKNELAHGLELGLAADERRGQPVENVARAVHSACADFSTARWLYLSSMVGKL